jgi:hypothetical protein
MQRLIARVSEITGSDLVTAKRAVGYVLMFLAEQAPFGKTAELIDKNPTAHEAVAAALAASDGGFTSIIAGVESLRGQGQADTLALEGKLANIGLDRDQIENLLTEVFSRAEQIIGTDGLEIMKRNHPDLARTLRYASGMME